MGFSKVETDKLTNQIRAELKRTNTKSENSLIEDVIGVGTFDLPEIIMFNVDEQAFSARLTKTGKLKRKSKRIHPRTY